MAPGADAVKSGVPAEPGQPDGPRTVISQGSIVLTGDRSTTLAFRVYQPVPR